jgi:O-antigen/teichoic acid export membrane protein
MMAKYRTARALVVNLVRVILSAALLGLLIFTSSLHRAEQVIAAQILAEAAALGVSFYLVRNEFRLSLGTSWRYMKKVLSFSMFAMGSTLVYRIYSRVDILMLAKLADPVQVAAYGACRSLTEFLIDIQRAGNQVLLPLVSRMWSQGRIRKIMRRILQAASLPTALILPVAAVMMLFPEWALEVLYKGKYNHGAAVPVILSSLAPFRPFLNSLSIASSAVGRPSISFQTVLVSSLVNLPLNAVLIPRMGGVGAAIATAAAILAGLAFVSVRFTRVWRAALPDGSTESLSRVDTASRTEEE